MAATATSLGTLASSPAAATGALLVDHAAHDRRTFGQLAKRALDVAAALTLLLVLLPAIAAVAAVVRWGDRGPVFFAQWRLGRDGVPFRMIKFRSMVVDAEARLIDLRAGNESDGPLFKLRHDPRVTLVGRALRATSLDELPQLWNVLRGEMSLVGPRPALASEAASWPTELWDRLSVRPGMTGLWQVSGRSATSFETYARLDLAYVRQWSLWLDLTILARTLPAVVARRGAS